MELIIVNQKNRNKKLDIKFVELKSNIQKTLWKNILVVNTLKNINVTLTVDDECKYCDKKQKDIQLIL